MDAIIIFQPREVAPRNEAGAEWGRDGAVIARGPKLAGLRLVWQPGGKYWSGVMGNRYAPAALVWRAPGYRGRAGEVFSGGRLSAARVLQHREAIDARLGAGAAEAAARAVREGTTAVCG